MTNDLRRLPVTNDGSRIDELRQSANAILDEGFSVDELRAYLESILLDRELFRLKSREWFERQEMLAEALETGAFV